MIGMGRGKEVAEMRRQAADLRQQVDDLSARLAGTTDRLATVGDGLATALERLDAQVAGSADAERRAEALAGRVADQAAAIERMEAWMAGSADAERRAEALAGRVADQAIVMERLETRLADQAAAIERLGEDARHREELDRRTRTDLVRMERQAVIDVAEFRRTTVALAERLLAAERRAAAVTGGADRHGSGITMLGSEPDA